MLKRFLSLFLCMVLLLSYIPVVSFATEAETGAAEEIQNAPMTLSEGELGGGTPYGMLLPEINDPMGTEYYFYNQLSDIEKVMYWKISEATWENPVITISGVSGYSVSQLDNLCQRALTALIADDPEYRMYWERHIMEKGILAGDIYSVSISKAEGSSKYLIQKSEARIQQIVKKVGTEGDTYSRAKDLLALMDQEMVYDPYHPFESNRKVFYSTSAIGCLVYNTAICAGFSDTVKILCDELKIPCITVGNDGHAWNFVRMDDGQWYAVDASIDFPSYCYWAYNNFLD